MKREPIKEWSGRIIGWIETESNGDKRITDFSGRILGFYKANYGRIIGRGDQLMTLLNNN